MAKRKSQILPPKRRAKKNIPPVIESVLGNGLTIKQQLFIDHYIVCMNGTQAARLAGYSGEEYTLANQASQNLRNPYILRELDNRLNRFAMSANEVLVHLTDVARGDITDALNEHGAIDPLEAKRRGKSHLMRRIKTKFTTFTDKDGNDHETEESEVEMYSRLEALQILAKFHSLLVDRVRHEDWRTDIIQLLKEGRVTPEQLEAEIGIELAEDIVATVVIPGVASRES